MNTRTHTIAAFALAVVTTLGIFSGVAGLSAPGHAGQMLVQATGNGHAAHSVGTTHKHA